MARIIRIGGSFAIVLVAYWAYALVAVPLIEPPADRQQSDRISEEAVNSRLHAAKERWREELEGLFPPGSPVLENNPKIVEIDPVKLIIEDYTRSADGKTVEIRPCTMIFMPDGSSADAAQRRRSSVVLEAATAVLEFDQPFDLSQAKVGRLTSGKLKGRITIRSQGKSPGPEDDLLVVTRDVDLNEERIWTEHPVDFRLGANHGRGRQMWIKLLPGDEDEGTQRRGPNVAGIELFEIRRLEKLHLRSGAEGLVPGVEKKNKKTPQAAPKKSDLASDLPIEVKCRGPFRFDPIQQVATFEDHVDVLRVHPEGPSDQLNCETLSVYFARPRKPTPTEATDAPDPSNPEPPQTLDLRPRRIEARGTPVVVRAPSQEINARGERLEYDFESGRIVLDGSREVFLKHGPDEIHARNLQYQTGEDGRLGEAIAEGPGWLRAQVGEKFGEQLSARWGKLLHLRPFEGQPVISLTGGAALEYGYIGQMTAGEIHFYLHESPPDDPGTPDQPRIRPDRMVALHQVRPNSLQLSGALEQWKVWFVEAQPVDAPDGSLRDGGGVARADRTGAPGTREPKPPRADPARKSSPLLAATSDAGVLAGPHFEILAESLETRVIMWDGRSEVSDLTVQGNVRLTQTRTSSPDERPLKLTAEYTHVEHASQPHRTVTVTGSPAHFEARGLGMTGSNINLNCGTNRLWIDGPGWMDLPMDRDLEGRTLSEPGRLKVEWQRRMTFDGRTARFEKSVLATSQQSGGQSNLETDTLDVSFLRPIRFADLDEQPETQVERIVCLGGAFMENRSFEDQAQVSMDRMFVAAMDINLTNGASTASGPGRMTTIRYGSSDLLTTGAGNPSPVAPLDPADSDDDQLTYLNVQFQGSLSGNVHNRQMTFHDQVKTVYGKVDSWQAELSPNDPDGLGPRGVLLSCNQLSVARMPLPTGDGDSTELAAQGNVVVEGQAFTARAPRMTYTDAKQLLILEGNGRTSAELYRQEHVGGPFSEFLAQKILYWRSTGQVHVEGARSLKAN